MLEEVKKWRMIKSDNSGWFPNGLVVARTIR